jgi:elongation factor P
MKINGNALRPGNVIEHRDRLWRVVRVQHTQPGKGGAYMQAELRDLRNGSKLNERFRAQEEVERVRLEQGTYQYLYAEGDQHVFMDPNNFEQVTIAAATIGEELVPFLQDGMDVSIEAFDGEILGVELPDSLVLEVTEADAVVKGQTASSSFKPAMLSNGVRIMVPPHIEAGTRLVINPTERTYVERAKD